MTHSDRHPDPNPTSDLVPLVGVRTVVSSEPDEAAKWQEGLIKRRTDGEPLEVNELISEIDSVPPDFSADLGGDLPSLIGQQTKAEGVQEPLPGERASQTDEYDGAEPAVRPAPSPDDGGAE